MKSKKILVIIAIILVISAPVSVYGYNLYGYNKQVKLGQAALEGENFQEADKCFRKALKYSKSHDKEISEKISFIESLKKHKELYEDGIKLMEAKKYNEAIVTFKKIPQDSKKYYGSAQSKISESTKLYIEDNITLAKSKAEGKSYNDAISYLDTVLKIDEKNQVALDLKGQYAKEIERINAEEETKKKTQEESTKEVQSSSSSKSSSTTTAKTDSNTSTKTNSHKTDKTDSNTSAKTNSNTSAKTNSNTNQNNTASSYIVKANGQGWFSVYKNSSDKFPEEMFGLKGMTYGIQPYGIYYKFVGNNINYTLTIHLPTGPIKYSGKSSDEFCLLSVPEKAPSGQQIKIDVAAVYKGKTYTDSFSMVINTSY